MTVSNYKAFVLKAHEGAREIPRNDGKHKELEKKINQFVQSQLFMRDIFQRKISSPVFRLKIKVIGDRFEILPDSVGVERTKPSESASLSAASSSSSPAPSISYTKQKGKTATSPPTDVRGFTNGANGCYANTAFQLIHNIPSLKDKIADRLAWFDHDDLKGLGDYSKIESAGQILKGVNLLRGKKSELTTARGEDIDEIFGTLFDQEALGYKGFSLRGSSKVTVPQAQKVTLESSPDLQRLVRADQISGSATKYKTLVLSPIGASFQTMLDNTMLDRTTKTATNSDANSAGTESKEKQITYDITSELQFVEAPSELMLQIPKFVRGTSKLTTGIQETLNLSKYMEAGVKAKPLYLKGFAHHQGSGEGSSGGHYVAYFVKKEGDETRYYRAGDSNDVRAVTKDEFLRRAQEASHLYYDDQKL